MLLITFSLDRVESDGVSVLPQDFHQVRLVREVEEAAALLALSLDLVANYLAEYVERDQLLGSFDGVPAVLPESRGDRLDVRPLIIPLFQVRANPAFQAVELIDGNSGAQVLKTQFLGVVEAGEQFGEAPEN